MRVLVLLLVLVLSQPVYAGEYPKEVKDAIHAFGPIESLVYQDSVMRIVFKDGTRYFGNIQGFKESEEDLVADPERHEIYKQFTALWDKLADAWKKLPVVGDGPENMPAAEINESLREANLAASDMIRLASQDPELHCPRLDILGRRGKFQFPQIKEVLKLCSVKNQIDFWVDFIKSPIALSKDLPTREEKIEAIRTVRKLATGYDERNIYVSDIADVVRDHDPESYEFLSKHKRFFFTGLYQ